MNGRGRPIPLWRGIEGRIAKVRELAAEEFLERLVGRISTAVLNRHDFSIFPPEDDLGDSLGEDVLELVEVHLEMGLGTEADLVPPGGFYDEVGTGRFLAEEHPIAGCDPVPQVGIDLGQARPGVEVLIEHRSADGEEDEKEKEDGGFPAHGWQSVRLSSGRGLGDVRAELREPVDDEILRGRGADDCHMIEFAIPTDAQDESGIALLEFLRRVCEPLDQFVDGGSERGDGIVIADFPDVIEIALEVVLTADAEHVPPAVMPLLAARVRLMNVKHPPAGSRQMPQERVQFYELRRLFLLQLVVEHRAADGEEEEKEEDDGGFPAHGISIQNRDHP